MIKLIMNELYKIIRKKSVLIFLVIILAYMVLINFVLSKYTEPDINNYEITDVEITYQEEFINSIDVTEYEQLANAYTDLFILNLQNENETLWTYNYLTENKTLIYNYYLAFLTEDSSEYLSDLEIALEDIKSNVVNDNWENYLIDLIEQNTVYISSLNAQSNDNLSDEEITDKNREISYYEYINEIYFYRINNNVSFDSGYLNDALIEVVELKYLELSTDANYEKSIAIQEYIIDNNVDVAATNNFKTNMMSFMHMYAQFIILFVLVIAGTILANEFNNGTIKTLLLSPNKRTKILICKFIAVIKSIFIVTIVLVLFQFVLSMIFYDIKDLSIPVLTFNSSTGELYAEHVLCYLAKQILAYIPTILFLALIAFCLTIVLSNSAVAVVGTFMLYIFSELANALIIVYDISFLKYFITLNWDFTCYLYGGTNAYESITLGFSIIIYLIYFIAISLLFIYFFKRKNIKNE